MNTESLGAWNKMDHSFTSSSLTSSLNSSFKSFIIFHCKHSYLKSREVLHQSIWPTPNWPLRGMREVMVKICVHLTHSGTKWFQQTSVSDFRSQYPCPRQDFVLHILKSGPVLKSLGPEARSSSHRYLCWKGLNSKQTRCYHQSPASEIWASSLSYKILVTLLTKPHLTTNAAVYTPIPFFFFFSSLFFFFPPFFLTWRHPRIIVLNVELPGEQPALNQPTKKIPKSAIQDDPSDVLSLTNMERPPSSDNGLLNLFPTLPSRLSQKLDIRVAARDLYYQI